MSKKEERIDELTWEILKLKQKLGLLTAEEEELLKQMEAKRKMDDLSVIQKDDDKLYEEENNPFGE